MALDRGPCLFHLEGKSKGKSRQELRRRLCPFEIQNIQPAEAAILQSPGYLHAIFKGQKGLYPYLHRNREAQI
jgi:hypothetical protein